MYNFCRSTNQLIKKKEKEKDLDYKIILKIFLLKKIPYNIIINIVNHGKYFTI